MRVTANRPRHGRAAGTSGAEPYRLEREVVNGGSHGRRNPRVFLGMESVFILKRLVFAKGPKFCSKSSVFAQGANICEGDKGCLGCSIRGKAEGRRGRMRNLAGGPRPPGSPLSQIHVAKNGRIFGPLCWVARTQSGSRSDKRLLSTARKWVAVASGEFAPKPLVPEAPRHAVWATRTDGALRVASRLTTTRFRARRRRGVGCGPVRCGVLRLLAPAPGPVPAR
jgi:hypothetical protein